MTVGKLIKELEKYPKNSNVCVTVIVPHKYDQTSFWRSERKVQVGQNAIGWVVISAETKEIK
jgi:hypothetical protein